MRKIKAIYDDYGGKVSFYLSKSYLVKTQTTEAQFFLTSFYNQFKTFIAESTAEFTDFCTDPSGAIIAFLNNLILYTRTTTTPPSEMFSSCMFRGIVTITTTREL